MKKLYIIILFLFSCSLSYPQDCTGLISKSRINRIDRQIMKCFHRADIASFDSAAIIHVFRVGLNSYADVCKERFVDASVISLFEPFERGWLKKTLDWYAIIYDPSKNIVALADNYDVYTDNKMDDDVREMAKLVLQNDIRCVYQISGLMSGNVFIGIGTDGKTYAIKTGLDLAQIWLVEECPDEIWQSFYF